MHGNGNHGDIPARHRPGCGGIVHDAHDRGRRHTFQAWRRRDRLSNTGFSGRMDGRCWGRRAACPHWFPVCGGATEISQGGDYVFRFRRTAGAPDENQLGTHALSIIGTDEKDRGPQMTTGFVNTYSSGGQVIRLLPLAEYAGADEATRTIARWGQTVSDDAAPPADQGSAPVLAGMVEDGRRPVPLECKGDKQARVCTIPAEQWPALEARWWRYIAEARLGRLDHGALRRCYDNTPPL